MLSFLEYLYILRYTARYTDTNIDTGTQKEADTDTDEETGEDTDVEEMKLSVFAHDLPRRVNERASVVQL
jgi:hypothetical protein